MFILTLPHFMVASTFMLIILRFFLYTLGIFLLPNAFVNILATCTLVPTWYTLMVPFFTSSLKSLYFMFKCFVLGLIFGTLAISMAPALS